MKGENEVELLFWYDFDNQKMIVEHIPSRERRVIDDPKMINRFLKSYQLTLEDLRTVRFGDDHLSLFRRMQVVQTVNK